MLCDQCAQSLHRFLGLIGYLKDFCDPVEGLRDRGGIIEGIDDTVVGFSGVDVLFFPVKQVSLFQFKLGQVILRPRVFLLEISYCLLRRRKLAPFRRARMILDSRCSRAESDCAD